MYGKVMISESNQKEISQESAFRDNWLEVKIKVIEEIIYWSISV